jgi:hypothetical protein
LASKLSSETMLLEEPGLAAGLSGALRVGAGPEERVLMGLACGALNLSTLDG